MIYNNSNIFILFLKIAIIIGVSIVAYKKEDIKTKNWLLISLISPYLGITSFIILNVLVKNEIIDIKKIDSCSSLILKYEIYLLIVSLMIIIAFLSFKNLI